MNEINEVEISLADILLILKKRFVWIFLACVILGGATFGYTKLFVPDTYKATASVYVYGNAGPETQYTTKSERDYAVSLVDTYIVVLESNTVMEKVLSTLNLDWSPDDLKRMVSCSAINGTEVFSVTVSYQDPAMAQLLADTIVKVAPAEIIRVVKAGGVEVLDYANLPTVPSAPNPIKDGVLGAIIGLILSWGIFLLVEIFDTKIWDEKSLTETFEFPVLGSIPKIYIDDKSHAKENSDK